MSSSSVEEKVPVTRRATCSACARRYREPRILPCLHTFCLDCVARLAPFRAPSSSGVVTVLCPDCDSEVDLPPSGPAGLSTDHLALDQVFLETLESDGPPGCDLCGEGGAESRCEECSVHLCAFCCQAHRRQRRTASHSVQLLEDLRSRSGLSRPILCGLHPGQELRLFCATCDLPVCQECSFTLHRDHGCRPLHDVVRRHGDRIRDLVTARLRPRLERLERDLERVEISQDALRAHVETTANQVRAFARGYASAVETHCLSLLHRLEDLRVTRRNQLHLQRAQLQQVVSDVRGGVEFAERLLGSGSDAGILGAKGVTLRRLGVLAESGSESHLVSLSPEDISFSPEPAGEVQGFPVVGRILHQTLDLNKCSVEGLLKVTEGQQGQFTLVLRDSSGEQLTSGGEHVVVSIAHTHKKNCSVEASLLDNQDGSYTASFRPQESGVYSLWVCVKTQHVKGSPFTLHVKKRSHTGVFHCCCFCSSAGNKEARCACPGVMPGGFKGCGHSHRGHPGKPHWSCCGSSAEKSDCLPASVLSAVSPRGQLRTVEL